MKWLGENWLRVILAIAALTASLGFVKFLHDQNALAVEIERNRQATQEAARQDRLAQEQREYVLKKSQACLAIYETEGKKWNNVTGWRYDELSDDCIVRFKSEKALSEEECKRRQANPLLGDDERYACLGVATRDVVHELGEASLRSDPADAPVGPVAVVIAQEDSERSPACL